MMDMAVQAWAGFAGLGLVGMAAIGLAMGVVIVFAFLERGWAAFAGLAALAAAAAYFGGGNPLWMVVDHPLLSILGALCYFVAGAFWSVAKFRFYTGKLKYKFREFKLIWLEKAGQSDLAQLDPAELQCFREEAQRTMDMDAKYGRYPVAPNEHKAEILFWMGWWPVSMAAYILDEPIKKLMEQLYRMFAGVYAKIAKDQSAEFMSAMGK